MNGDKQYHKPVLHREAISYLITDPNGIYIDGTLGGGGHSSLILQQLGTNGKLIAFDKDIEAIEFCRERFKEILARSVPQLQLRNESFSKACSIAEEIGNIQGLLLDLGVSSKHFDSTSGGFSYRTNSQLDMRFYPVGRTAEDLINSATEEELERIFRIYGEEKYSHKIARRICSVRRVRALRTTFDLRDVIIEAVPTHNPIDNLSRVFQAIRIVVNRELEELENTLTSVLPVLNLGGRLVIISYHSLEDRIVKHFFKEHSEPKTHQNKYKTNVKQSNSVPTLQILTNKPIIPSKEEQKENSRSRSAKMRVAERIA